MTPGAILEVTPGMIYGASLRTREDLRGRDSRNADSAFAGFQGSARFRNGERRDIRDDGNADVMFTIAMRWFPLVEYVLTQHAAVLLQRSRSDSRMQVSGHPKAHHSESSCVPCPPSSVTPLTGSIDFLLITFLLISPPLWECVRVYSACWSTVPHRISLMPPAHRALCHHSLRAAAARLGISALLKVVTSRGSERRQLSFPSLFGSAKRLWDFLRLTSVIERVSTEQA